MEIRWSVKCSRFKWNLLFFICQWTLYRLSIKQHDDSRRNFPHLTILNAKQIIPTTKKVQTFLLFFLLGKQFAWMCRSAQLELFFLWKLFSRSNLFFELPNSHQNSSDLSYRQVLIFGVEKSSFFSIVNCKRKTKTKIDWRLFVPLQISDNEKV